MMQRWLGRDDQVGRDREGYEEMKRRALEEEMEKMRKLEEFLASLGRAERVSNIFTPRLLVVCLIWRPGVAVNAVIVMNQMQPETCSPRLTSSSDTCSLPQLPMGDPQIPRA
jgi:hypothetical protein